MWWQLTTRPLGLLPSVVPTASASRLVISYDALRKRKQRAIAKGCPKCGTTVKSSNRSRRTWDTPDRQLRWPSLLAGVLRHYCAALWHLSNVHSISSGWMKRVVELDLPEGYKNLSLS